MGASQAALVVKNLSKNLPVNAGDIREAGLIPGLGRSPAGGYGNPFQYSYLENSMDNEPGKLESIAFQSRTRLRNFHTHN